MQKVSVKQAKNIQNELSNRVITTKSFTQLNIICGIDLTVIKEKKILICGIVNFKYPELEEIERVHQRFSENFPYIPGLLSFREGPAILETYKLLKTKPDLLVFDGQGIAHPRGLGIASHIGVVLDMPAIGIAKKKLYGNFREPKREKYSYSYLTSPHDDKTIGAVLRTKSGTKPVFVSIGNKIDLQSAIDIAITCDGGYRIPEPTRQADLYVKSLRRKFVANELN